MVTSAEKSDPKVGICGVRLTLACPKPKVEQRRRQSENLRENPFPKKGDVVAKVHLCGRVKVPCKSVVLLFFSSDIFVSRLPFSFDTPLIIH